MAWPNPFRRRDENTRTCWGYTFQLTPEHWTLEQSHPLKHSYDVLGEECLAILNQISPPPPRPSSRTPAENGVGSTTATATLSLESKVVSPDKSSKPKRDLYVLLRDNRHRHPKLQQLWDDASNPPFEVDWEQIARGQDVFYRYGGACLTGLACKSRYLGIRKEYLARKGQNGSSRDSVLPRPLPPPLPRLSPASSAI
jgi:hypothetical protein